MADLNAQQRQSGTRTWSVAQRNETALMLEDMYKGIAGDLRSVKKEILTEMKYNSLQTGVMYQSFEQGNKDTYAALKEELTQICDRISEKLEEAVKTLRKAAEQVVVEQEQVVPVVEASNVQRATTQESAAKVADCAVDRAVMEIKYVFSQNQSIYESLSSALNELKEKTEALDAAFGEKFNETLGLLDQKIESLLACETDYDRVAETVKERVVDAFPYEETDYEKIAETFAEKTETQVAAHAKEILDTLAAVPVAENVDYNRIVDEVSDRVLEKITELLNAKTEEEKEMRNGAEYDRIVYGTAEKVVESLPPVERIDYARIAEANKVTDETLEKLAEAVAAKIEIPQPEAIDYDKLAETLATKIEIPQPEAIDYDKLAEAVILKMPAAEEIDYERLAYAAASKIELPEAETIDYDRIVNDVAATIEIPEPEQIDYDRLAVSVAERLPVPEPATYEVMVDDEGIKTIADKVAETVCRNLPETKEAEVDAEALATEISEKIGNPTYETILDENGAQMIADAVAERLAANQYAAVTLPLEETAPVETVEEVATAQDVQSEQTEPVVAEDDLVVRIDRSFTAKLKQSADEVKDRYGMIKNALLSYKKVKSTVSWNADRFNCGRATIAKMNIRGKTLCVYFALDPNNPEFKQTVYNQKDMSEQKAYEQTPFMMKIKSDLAAKRAVHLVEVLAEHHAFAKKKDFEEVDYKKTYRYAGDRQLELTGLLRKSMGKRAVFDFD